MSALSLRLPEPVQSRGCKPKKTLYKKARLREAKMYNVGTTPIIAISKASTTRAKNRKNRIGLEI